MRRTISVKQDLVVDTGALLCALVLNYLSETGAPESKRRRLIERTIPKRYLGRPRFDHEYRAALEHRRLATVPYAVAEVQGLINGRGKLSGDDYQGFWLHSLRYLETRVVEEPLSLHELCSDPKIREIVLQIGPTDAAMIALAYKLRRSVLTLDLRTLARYAKAFQIPCLLPDEILRP